jgi:thioesterase domain-containing protein
VARVSPQELEQYLHDAIPLSRAMQISVLELTETCALLGAPLAPNVNHRGTVFGGSACTLSILACWSLLYCRLQDRVPAASLVLQSNSMSYQRPVAQPFSARAELAPDARWAEFVRTLERRGKARICVCARLLCAGEEAGRFAGEFVALSAAAVRPELLAISGGSDA